MQRIIVNSPGGWNRLKRQLPERASLVEEWIEAEIVKIPCDQLIEVGTTLNLGLDTVIARIALELNISYHVFLSCGEQEKLWDPEKQELFKRLLAEASSSELITRGHYTPGCIKRQSLRLTNWAAEGDSALVLTIKRGKLTPAQQERKNALEGIASFPTFNW